MSEVRVVEVCVCCGHSIARHYEDPLKIIRCMVVERGETTSGVIGLPYERECLCSNYELPK